MTLLFFDGLQDPVASPKFEWISGAWGGVGAGRDGVANSAAGGQTPGRTLQLSTPAATCIVGTAHKPTINGSDVNTIIGFQTAGAVQQLAIRWGTTGLLEVRKGTASAGTLLGTSSGHAPQISGNWAHVQAKAVLHTTNGSVEVRLNGVTVLTLTGVSTSTVNGPTSHILCGSTQQLFAFWDDIYVCDGVDATATQGRPNNDFLGDLRVATLFPTAAGDVTGWTPSTGANWSCLDENPVNTTDYVSVVSTATGTRDLYNIQDLTGTIVDIYGVQVSAYGTKTDAGAAQVKPVIKESVSGTVTVYGALAPPFGSYVSLMGTLQPVKAAGTLWSVSDINNLQIGVEVG